MKKLFIFIMLFIVVLSNAQTSNRIRVWIKSNDAKPTILKHGDNLTDNDKLNRIFKKYSVFSYVQACPFAKNPELRKEYRIKCNVDVEKLKQDLKNNASELFSDVVVQPKPISCYNPSDYMWFLTLQDTTGWLWHLKKIQADKAWDITKGSSNVHIAMEDTWFDINHPDLATKISPHYDPYLKSIGQDEEFSSDPYQEHHGTYTSALAASQTDGGGQLASVGFNTMMYGFDYWDGLDGALYAADVLHADVLSCSFYEYCYSQVDDSTRYKDSLKIKEILDAGTIIVAAAGNGYSGSSCSLNNDNRPPFKPVYPFSNTYDSRVIVVTSSDALDRHRYFSSSGVEITNSYFSGVDICSPGYNILSATCTKNTDGTNNTWPYWGGSCGTSDATPIVSGVCALMKSIDPYLTPAKAKTIIKANADPIADASLYPGMVGAGRINANKCVMATGTKSATGVYGGTNTYTAGYAAKLNNVSIQNNANITITARNIINITGTFVVNAGSAIHFGVNNSTVNSNNW